MGGRWIEEVGVVLGLGENASLERVASVLIADHRAGRRALREPEPLPTIAEIDRWTAGIRPGAPVLRYLQRERGLSFETIDKYALGYAPEGTGSPVFGDTPAITLPVFRKAKVRGLKRRFWPNPVAVSGKEVKTANLRGRDALLYPDAPQRRHWLLCEGEFDALLARQHGLPAVTSTAGQSWNEAWSPLVAGRPVAVVYDVGAERAGRTVERLRAAGADAWAVDLGLPERGDDLTDWFVKYGRSVEELRKLINRARRSA